MEAFTIKTVGGGFEKIDRQLKRMTRTETRKVLKKVLTRETLPVRKEIRAAALGTLPHRGGLNKWAAVMPSTHTRFTGRDTSVKVVDQKRGHDLKSLNAGRLRHPLFGDRQHWYTQQIAPGFFSTVVRLNEGRVKDNVATAVRQYVDGLMEGKNL